MPRSEAAGAGRGASSSPGHTRESSPPQNRPLVINAHCHIQCDLRAPLAAVLLALLTAYALSSVPVDPEAVRRALGAALERYVLFWRPAPAGHRRPLGSHRAPQAEPLDVLDAYPEPGEFFSKYVRPQRPVVFRGLARLHPAFRLWTDQYLRDNFGHLTLDIEVKKKEDRTKELIAATFEQFLSIYKEEDMYVVHSIQDEMKNDLVLPRSVQCGGMQRILTDVVMWFSSGGTRSVLHYDEMDNINCVLDGQKYFFLVDVDHAKDHIDFDHMEGLYSSVDVESVDMYKFPGLRDVPWYNVTLEKGDCFYLPYKWPHHVRSSDSRNLAVNMWFTRLLWLNETDCAGKTLSDSASLGEFDQSESAYVQQADIISLAEDFEQLTVLSFADLYQNLLPEGPDAAERAFDALDKDADGLLTLAEMYGHEPARFLRLFPGYEPRGE